MLFRTWSLQYGLGFEAVRASDNAGTSFKLALQ